MLFRPRGMMGMRELTWFVPVRDRLASRSGPEGAKATDAPVADPHLTHRFNGLAAVSDFNLDLEPQELVVSSARTGPARQPSSTLLRAFTGPRAAASAWKAGNSWPGAEPDHLPGHRPTFQNIRLFQELTALDNVRIAHYGKVRYSLFRPCSAWAVFNGRKKRLRTIPLRS